MHVMSRAGTAASPLVLHGVVLLPRGLEAVAAFRGRLHKLLCLHQRACIVRARLPMSAGVHPTVYDMRPPLHRHVCCHEVPFAMR